MTNNLLPSSKIPASARLWRIIKEKDGYYYEIRLAGTVIDRFKIPEASLLNIKTL